MPELSAQQRERAAARGQAMPGGRFPIRNRADLQRAIRAVGRSKGGEAGRKAVRRFIFKRAKTLGLAELIPPTWRADGSLAS
jgi:hypothetical protein